MCDIKRCRTHEDICIHGWLFLYIFFSVYICERKFSYHLFDIFWSFWYCSISPYFFFVTRHNFEICLNKNINKIFCLLLYFFCSVSIHFYLIYFFRKYELYIYSIAQRYLLSIWNSSQKNLTMVVILISIKYIMLVSLHRNWLIEWLRIVTMQPYRTVF